MWSLHKTDLPKGYKDYNKDTGQMIKDDRLTLSSKIMKPKRTYKKRNSFEFDCEKLNRLISESGLNKQEFANSVGIMRPIVSKLTNGLSFTPSATTVIKIADFFNIKDVRDLFKGTKFKKKIMTLDEICIRYYNKDYYSLKNDRSRVVALECYSNQFKPI